jgi:peptidylprolyl isomerase
MRLKLIAVALFAASSIFASAQDGKAPATDIVTLKVGDKLPAKVTKLTVIDREIGNTQKPKITTGGAVLVHYTGWLYDASKPDGKGEQFDSSQGRVTPFGFVVGGGRVIKGWDQGIVGMHEKGKRTLIIPPELAYGANERPKIPANSTLLFDVDLFEILSTGGGAVAAPAPLPPVTPKLLKAMDPLPSEVSELHIIERTVGTGKSAESGPVQVHYTGWLYDPKAKDGKGTKFDSSVDRGQPFGFPVGGGRVIRGWDVGVAGMKEGGKRTLIIPPSLGYGSRGAGGVIPPGAVLLFDVELIKVGS